MRDDLEQRRAKWRLYLKSMELLKTQWVIGPLAGHRGCCRLPLAATKRWLASNPKARIRLWQFASGRYRCRSNSCRPGDPFGCSMANERLNEDRTESIVGSWIGADHSVYLCRFDVYGEPGDALDHVMDAAQLAMKQALGSGSWLASKVKHGVAGQIMSLSIRSFANRWVVRRWLILGTAGELEAEEIVELTRSLRSRWGRSLNRGEKQFSLRTSALKAVGADDVLATAQLVTGTDASVIDMAARYRGSEADLVGLYGDSEVGGSEELAIFELPEPSRDFMEYANALFAVKTWSAYRSGGSREIDAAWNRSIDDARAIKHRYIDVEISTANRSGKK